MRPRLRSRLDVGLETLRVDATVGPDICCVCRKPPIAERLMLVLSRGDDTFDVTICRHCLGEHVPHLLETVETRMPPPGVLDQEQGEP